MDEEKQKFHDVKIADAENHILQDVDECNLEHPKVPNKPHLLRCGKTQGLFDYTKLGLKCGLEIHQQLDTKKLFCNCPSLLRKDEPDVIIERRLHPVSGETGDIDEAAEFEALKNKIFVYQGYSDSNCLLEYDESPPYEINKESLKIGLQIALLLNCKIIPLTQIMRKTVIDGSNTSGFQRSVFIARDGYVETSFGKIVIGSVYLEEDAARLVSREKGKTIFRLDRLGIPLVEIQTEPDIKTAEQAKETALKIGQILRSCKVKRGIGTIRQDVNLSIRGGERIELKGFQDIRNIERAIETEIKRQLELVKEGKSIAEVRNVLVDGSSEFLRPLPGAARMYPETDLPLLKISLDLINEAKKEMPKLKEDIRKEFKSKGLHKEMVKLLFKENKIEEFKELLKIIDNANLIAKVLLIFPKEIARQKEIFPEKINFLLEDHLGSILLAVKKGKISERDIKHVMEEIVSGKNFEEAIKIEKVEVGELEEKIMNLIKSKPGLTENAYMGLLMKELKGRIDGKTLIGLIQKFLKK